MRLRVLLGLAVGLLLALSACGRAPGKTDVQVTLSDFRVQSSLSAFQVGVPYHFVVSNKGGTDHEFMILQPGMGNRPMEQMHEMALAHIDQLAPGETKTIDYTFRQAAPAGSLEMVCYLNGHYNAGMKQPIVVK